ncbi:sulfite exporter TauE/SafE family protein [Pontibacter diazotrophicus]|uniref:Probable membrane transporter protein n=1 Tax=Pontibacter diazotrophicus TaxID=1400979 RepID=A0A3D8L843_9BACT|nr:sulfite exporter TauE/SafE family protein [Pontibacter diazotrophicus]RDV13575.1 sulfite exporter TauE/SafE family protein [Pontibacter diazotrophicus]
MPHWELMLFFFVIAFVYASVGFGGGSSYLAILALYGLPFKELRLIALLCNVVVVTGGTILFIRNKQVNWRKIVPLALTSVPMAFMGAMLRIEQHTFYVLLGCSLLTAAGLLWFRKRPQEVPESATPRNTSYAQDGALGGSIGFLSGMIGIGGGIFLSPLLNLIGWDTPKRIAATASFFILVNSISGIAGQLTQLPSTVNYSLILFLCVAVFAGGQLGSRMAIKKFNPLVIRRMTAILIFVAGIEVIYKHLS